MYEDAEIVVELNLDEKCFLIEMLDNFSYSSTAECLLIAGLIDKLNEK